jgi:hypothetical protein
MQRLPVNLHQSDFPLLYGIPSAAGARTLPINPVTAMTVTTYGAINMNSLGIGVPVI